MRNARKIDTTLSDEMVELIKSSCKDYIVSSIEISKKYKVSMGLSYYKNIVWEVGDDIYPIRPDREIIEVFVGFDSEYKDVRVWPKWSEEDLYHASISSKHVKGEMVFQELDPAKRKEVERRNKIKSAGFRNVPISYQLAIFSPRLSVLRNIILLTGEQKVSFKDIIARLVDILLKGVKLEVARHPILRVFLISHFSLAEMQTFSDFNTLKREFDSVRGTYLTIGASFELNTPAPPETRRGSIDVEVILNDTMLLAPAGYQNLSALGGVVGLEKIEIDPAYKERMDLLLSSDRALFCDYAIRDAVIALAYWVGVHVITGRSINRKLYQTVGSIAVGYFNNFLKAAGLRRKVFFGSGYQQYSLYEKFAINAFHGGRNESLHVGFLNATLYDVDLAGAYSIAMAHLPQLDHSGSFVTTDLNHFLSVDITGFAEVEFEFPESVKIPSLPVKSKGGLIYPRRGVSFCTSYELYLAARQGVSLRVLTGLVIPSADGESVLMRFVRDIRAERSKYEKGTLSNNFYKLILNSLYGRFAFGINQKQFFNARTGVYETQNASANSNPYLASLVTGFIRAVLSELAHELSIRGHLVVSMTTDGLITDCPLPTILQTIDSPLVNAFRNLTEEIGMDSDRWLELKAETVALFSWKTRGQLALDHGKISAMAGLQKPRSATFPEFKAWFFSNVADDGVKTLNEINRLASLLEVFKGAPFGRVEYLKYISTQFDFKRKLVEYDKDSLTSQPWDDIKEMEEFKKKYANGYPFKVNSKESLEAFERYAADLDTRAKAERSRKRRLETPFRVSSLLPAVLKQCSRTALKGCAGFSRPYKARELIDFLSRHGISRYTHGKFSSKIDSNFCKNQARREISFNSVPLSVDVFMILSLFTKLDPTFDPRELIFTPEFIEKLPQARVIQLKKILPDRIGDVEWAEEYQKALALRLE